MSAAHVVQQASGCRDHDVDTPPERACLGLHPDATVDRDGVQPGVAAVGPRAVQHLLGQLTGRHQHERPERAARAGLETLQYRQQKRRRLAGSRLGGTDQIAAFQADRDRLLLNRGGLLVALLFESPQQSGREAQ